MKKVKKLNRRDFIKLSSIASVSLPITLSLHHQFLILQSFLLQDYLINFQC